MRLGLMMLGAVAAAVLSGPARAASDWAAVGSALGKSGAVQAGGVYKVAFPRSDLKVTLDGVPIKPGFALGGWVAFRDMGDHAMVMGDLVLTQSEVNPVMSALEDGGIAITALHNHLLRSTPFTMYMHIEGQGDAVKLATAVHAALARSKTPMGAAPPPAAAAPLGFDPATIDQILGAKGAVNGGILQYGIARADPPKSGGMSIPGPMGAATSINFQPLGGGKAAITGDFVLTADEVNPVVKALRSNGIEVTAIHNHMLDDEPRIFFMHFWAHDDAGKLAKGLRAALDQVKIAR